MDFAGDHVSLQCQKVVESDFVDIHVPLQCQKAEHPSMLSEQEGK